MKLSKLGILYVSLCAVITAVACSGEDASDSDPAQRAASGSASDTVVVDKAVDGGVTTSDAAP
jgi:hypothetical protein